MTLQLGDTDGRSYAYLVVAPWRLQAHHKSKEVPYSETEKPDPEAASIKNSRILLEHIQVIVLKGSMYLNEGCKVYMSTWIVNLSGVYFQLDYWIDYLIGPTSLSRDLNSHPITQMAVFDF